MGGGVALRVLCRQVPDMSGYVAGKLIYRSNLSHCAIQASAPFGEALNGWG
jgi:hypothetical protein